MAKYSTECKLKVVQEYLAGRGSYETLSKLYHVSRKSIEEWVKVYQAFGDDGLRRSRAQQTYTHHVCCDLEYDTCLLTISSTAIHLGSLLPIAAAKKKCNSSRKLALPVLLPYLDIRRVELAIPIRLQNSENISDNALLPVDEFKGLSCPRPLRMA